MERYLALPHGAKIYHSKPATAATEEGLGSKPTRLGSNQPINMGHLSIAVNTIVVL